MDAFGASRDRCKHDIGCRHGEILAVMLTHADEVYSQLVGECGLLNEVPDDLRVQALKPLERMFEMGAA